MHSYRRYVVGDRSGWLVYFEAHDERKIRIFAREIDAMMFVSFLNGGCRTIAIGSEEYKAIEHALGVSDLL